MKKEALACILWITLMLAAVLNVSSSPSSTGDLINHGIAYPVQVVWQFSDTAKGLVANKSTAIRVFVESTFTERVWVEINVTYNFGTQWYVERGRDGNGIPIDPGYNTIYIPDGPAFPADPLGWGRYPHISLLWTRTGLDSKIEVIVNPLEVQETDETNNRCTFEAVNVVKSRPLKILVVPLTTDSSRWSIALDHQMNFLRDTYPVADDSISVTLGEQVQVVDFSRYGGPSEDLLYNLYIRDLSEEARILGYDRVVAVISQSLRFGWSGNAIGMLREPEDRIPVVVVDIALSQNVLAVEGSSDWAGIVSHAKLVAHEIGHTFYLWHPHDIGTRVYDAKCYWVKAREYGETVNTFMSYRAPPCWIDEGRYNSDPKTWIDLSEYDTEVDGTWQWNLFDQLTTPTICIPTVLLGGWIFLNGTVKLDQNWYRIPEGIPDLLPGQVAPQMGDYTIFLLNNVQQVLSQMSFNVSFTYLFDLNGTLVKKKTEAVPFLFNVPYVDGTSFIQIRNATGHILQERVITANPPVVSVTFPNGGESLKIGTNYAITWESYDPDGDELNYLVAYSRDGGETWIPLANNLNETYYVWNTSNLVAGDKYLVKVIATDGINTGEDESNSTFTTVDLTPPVISNVTQHPLPDSVQPNKNVTVHANVSDVNSGVKNVALSYRHSINNGSTWSPWANVTMNPQTGNTFNGSILGFSDGTFVQYKIFAVDNSNNSAVNNNAGKYYVYTVIPEFPSILIMPLFMISTLLAVLVYKRRHPHAKKSL